MILQPKEITRWCRIEKSKIKVDDTLADLVLEAKDFEHPALSFSLDIDRLDLNRYLMVAPKNKGEQVGPIQSAQGTEEYSALRNIILAGKIRLQELAFGGGKISKLNINLQSKDGIFRVDPSTFDLYQGSAQTTLTADFQNDTPQTSIEIKAHGVEAGPLLHDFAARDFLNGSLDADVQLHFSGISTDMIKKSLYADGALDVKNGMLEGIDMINAKRNIIAPSSASNSSSRNLSTKFSVLKSIFSIRNGLLESHETTLSSPSAKVLISGTADLVSEKLQLTVEPSAVVNMQENQQSNKNDEETFVPFTLSGALAGPQVNIDPRYFSKEELESPAVLKMKDLVEEKLPAPADDDARNLVGTPLIDPAVVAQRFHLQPELIRKNRIKKQLKLGSGKIRVNPFREEDSWH